MQQRHPAAAVRMTGLPHRLRPDRGMFQCRYSIFTGLPNRLRPGHVSVSLQHIQRTESSVRLCRAAAAALTRGLLHLIALCCEQVLHHALMDGVVVHAQYKEAVVNIVVELRQLQPYRIPLRQAGGRDSSTRKLL